MADDTSDYPEAERLEVEGPVLCDMVAEMFAEPLEMIVDARRKFVEKLRDRHFQEALRGSDKDKAEVSRLFHETLGLMEDHSLCDYTKLADRVDVSRSQVNRWFKPDNPNESPSVPSKVVRIGAMTELANIIEEETDAMARAIKAVKTSI